MASKNACTLTVSMRVEYVDGDGSRCLECRDRIFGRAGELVLTVNPKISEFRPFKGGLFCGSCAQVLEERLEEKETP